MAMRVLAALFCVSSLLAMPAAAGSIEDCKGLADEAAVGACLEEEFEVAQQRLAQAAGALERALRQIDGIVRPQVDAIAKFRAAHDQWTMFRNRDCAFLGSVENWGEGADGDILECLIVATDDRSERYAGLADGLTRRHLE